MDLFNILKKVGSSILVDVIPGANTVIAAVNAFLPDDKKLGDKATGSDIQRAVNSLPVEQKTALLSKEFDVEITEIKEHTQVIQALGEVDKTGNSTRPTIALMMAKIVAFAVVVLITFLAIAVFNGDEKTVTALGDNWPLVVAILGTPTALLRSYFGMRTKEKQQKYQAVSNTPPHSLLTSAFELLRKNK